MRGNGAMMDELRRGREPPAAAEVAPAAAEVELAAAVESPAAASTWRPLVIDPARLAGVVATVTALLPADIRDAEAESGVATVVAECARGGVRNPDQVGYLLATAEHESKFGHHLFERSESLVEDHNPFTSRTRRDRRSRRDVTTWSSTVHTNDRTVSADSEGALETAYWDAAYGGRLGNAAGTTDARDYRGRGYVQLTGRSNYQQMSDALTGEGYTYTLDGTTWGGPGHPAIDLVAHPDHVNRCRELAAHIMVKGMREGRFTGRALGESIPAEAPADGTGPSEDQWTESRRVVNGDVAENGATIADRARTYAQALRQGDAWAQLFAPAAPPRLNT